MLKPPRSAQEAFERLAPDLQEIADFITHCPLTAPGRMQLANLLADYFRGVAVSGQPTSVRLVSDAETIPGGDEQSGTV